jgi:hypothetical protein
MPALDDGFPLADVAFVPAMPKAEIALASFPRVAQGKVLQWGWLALGWDSWIGDRRVQTVEN